MKEFGKAAGIAIIAIILAVMATLAIIKWKGERFLPKNYDSSVEVTQADINNPVILSLSDAVDLQKKMKDDMRIDSLFLTMSKVDLNNVIGVLINRGAASMKKVDIINEYAAGRAVYENLPTQELKSNQTTTQDPPIAEIKLESQGTTTVTEAPPTRVDNSKQPAKDTIINGKKYKQVE